MGTKYSQFPASSEINPSDVLVGLHNDGNSRFSFSTILVWIRQSVASFFVPTSRTVNNKALSQDISLGAADVGARADTWMPSASDVGAQPTITANGILKGDGQGGVTAAVAGTDYGTYSKPSGGIPASDLASGVIPSVPSAYASNPAMDGTASPGSSNDYARGDHVHPVDTSRASASAVASLDERYTNNTTWRMNTDANDYKTSGMYAMATGNANVPVPWGILFVQGPISDTIEQEYRYANNIWNREFRNNAWSEWTLTGNQAQLAYVETGTTASQNYTAGQYISLNGLLYTADTAIASGATFYTSGGNKNLTECVGGGFNSVRVSHLDYVTTSDLTLSPMSNGFYDVTSAIPAGYEPISGKIVAPTVHAQSYLMVWFNEWMGTIRCNVFLIGELARTVPTGTKIRIFYVKK